MSKLARTVLSVAVFVMSASEAWAAGNAHHEAPDFTTLLWPVVNFGIYFFILSWIYKKHGRPALLARTASVEQQLRHAASVRVDAERELADARERLDRIEEEKGQITQRLQEESKRMATQMLENARQAANNAELDVRRRIASEEAHAAADVRAEVIARAAKLARERLSVALSEEDDYRLRQETLRGLL